ncbi:MAG: CDIF630_02480 family spore surface protein [Bacillota bacterium]
MAKNKFKEKNMGMPIENHQTAAWANIEKQKPHSRVPIPNDKEVINAKEWVEENQK